ncbi:uncharacterized protein N7484_007199 [Penicillium longicatenatum]|uniref:uncharacterized protein n=1 Tax=Penicillium longicatenatum TaxID=1561947 RepID=UPI0025471BAF|nr:uncharacterized protein N7484_007199 [Penicillium longicatenatum]KAJ5639337.1 hypothetical protein N7484_007199 [Penicillium longicatenatum]
MFKGKPREEQQQTASMQTIEEFVSVQSFEAFLQWPWLRKNKFDMDEPERQIAAIVELARFADMCNATEMQSEIAGYLKAILIENPNAKFRDARTL